MGEGGAGNSMYGRSWLPYGEGVVTFYMSDNCTTDLEPLCRSGGRGGSPAFSGSFYICKKRDRVTDVTDVTVGVSRWLSMV